MAFDSRSGYPQHELLRFHPLPSIRGQPKQCKEQGLPRGDAGKPPSCLPSPPPAATQRGLPEEPGAARAGQRNTTGRKRESRE
jgi:hypothetical protein